ncbi:glycosyltransferase family protein [Alkalihalobacillus sp. LMS6]|uniref:glycosyltransferase family protein n=1 Tax=Alkalihalobacillus sp. LMS6 TaxID=2924034 RepID=UPI0020D0BBD6|nr:glycosyltransferase family protein [Alkalihalobacillus sp. LMS6]UTR05125.1 glycosyltransferase family protein [Alkalihalobacillus sp. LMS6]
MISNTTISFISCVSNETLYKQCLAHIQQLSIPSGMSIETVPIYNATSMTAGYNEGMKKAKGTYKVYLHQDAFILNQSFLYDLLFLFHNNKKLGLFGVIGARQLPHHGMWWQSPYENKIGKIIEVRDTYTQTTCMETTYMYGKAACVDGLLMATQYDLSWPEEIRGWHFYDTAQCLHYSTHNYDVGIAHQPSPWVIHYCKTSTMEGYYEALPAFQKWRSLIDDSTKT